MPPEQNESIKDNGPAIRDDHADDATYDKTKDQPEPVDAVAALEDRQAAQRKQFEAEQEGRATHFEHEQEAAKTKLERDQATAQEKAKADAALREANQANDEQAYADGILTDTDMATRSQVLAQHHGCLMPHEALLPNEPTVKMAFPRTVMLTRSATDIRNSDPLWASGNFDGNYPNAITHGSKVLFLKGYQDVPESLADHEYLFHNGAYRLNDDGKPETPVQRAERIAAKTQAKYDAPRGERDVPPSARANRPNAG